MKKLAVLVVLLCLSAAPATAGWKECHDECMTDSEKCASHCSAPEGCEDYCTEKTTKCTDQCSSQFPTASACHDKCDTDFEDHEERAYKLCSQACPKNK
ncbi:MAG TPA: hypothetical protein VL625_01710 [Patescibacteria group bacterium]|nr:hypothetical protein [Patescibacteria group bacterium]